MQLNPKHVTLNGLLLGRLFRIPDYQRAYAWEKKQRDDLFNDINEVGVTRRFVQNCTLSRNTNEISALQNWALRVASGSRGRVNGVPL